MKLNKANNKRVLFLSDPDSPHTVKWIRGLTEKGIEIFLFGLTGYRNNLYSGIKNMQVFSMNMKLSNTQVTGTRLTKLKYLNALPRLKKIISDFDPSLVHAHYATSYGLLGALSGKHPLITSLWGSDVYDFPSKSFLFQSIFRFVLNRSDALLSTSASMAEEASKYYKKRITVTPFGVDINLFDYKKTESIFGTDEYVVGVAKNLEDVYGIDILMKAFAILKKNNPEKCFKLLIIGTGTKEENLKRLAGELSIEKDTVFTGRVLNEKLPEYYSMMDVAVFLSRKESFGVSALEAMSCGRPVVATGTEGFKEIIADGETGLIVEPDDPEAAASAIQRVYRNQELGLQMGRKGRERVLKNYNYFESLNKMLTVYNKYLG